MLISLWSAIHSNAFLLNFLLANVTMTSIQNYCNLYSNAIFVSAKVMFLHLSAHRHGTCVAMCFVLHTANFFSSMINSQTPLNAPLGMPAIPQRLIDFIFPDEAGNAEDCVVDENALAEIRAVARRSNHKATPPTTSFAVGSSSTAVSSNTSLQDIIPASQQVLSMFHSSQSLTSTSATSSMQSLAKSLGLTGSQGMSQIIR